jgi:predicted GH43/DUF377 family glycosyl hydrolase
MMLSEMGTRVPILPATRLLNFLLPRHLCALLLLISLVAPALAQKDTAAGWSKPPQNPVLGGKHGTCFDISVLREKETYRMWLSWRPKASIALVESPDGFRWSEPPREVLGPRKETGWEDDINRPVVLKREDGYHMWYTGQAKSRSWIGYATSADGWNWRRMSEKPVLSPDQPWEKGAVMCPHVLRDEEAGLYKMWYSAGDQYEPDAIGYATSPDGLKWTKSEQNPVFKPNPKSSWEKAKVTGCQVIKHGGSYLMFYIGFETVQHAQIGVARSPNGITGWQRHPANPIIRTSNWGSGDDWDASACYKPFALFDGKKWLLWYNGRRGNTREDGGGLEQIGVAVHKGEDLGFPPVAAVLKTDAYRHYIDTFNQNDEELYFGSIPNRSSWDFLSANIPLLDCPDKEIEEIYYFRWWSYRKHIKQTPDGFIVDEFLPNVGWAGKHNAISCAAAHHFREGRWLADPRYLDDYGPFWLRKGGAVRTYSFWIADSVWQRYCVTGDPSPALELLPDLVRNYEAWEKERRDANGLYWQEDGQDGMEVSIGGSGYRATINSYQYGDALAIAQIAQLAGKPELVKEFRAKAARIKELVETKLWDSEAQFYKVLPRGEGTQRAQVRELHGFTPWYFNLPAADRSIAWRQLIDPKGFHAPFGPTTAEQRHPKFSLSYQGHECQWNGPSWPYSTAVTLTALANLLRDYQQPHLKLADYLDLLRIYTRSHRLKLDDGRVVPWIDENLNPHNGDWIARTRLKSWKNGTWDSEKGGKERGKDYNHSTYCDLVITGLIGLRPRADDQVEVHPLLPPGEWDYFCLDRIPYHGRQLTILFDTTGKRYSRGKGFRVFADGKEIVSTRKLSRVVGRLP